MNSMHVKKGDKVRVLSGKDKGKEGVILRALPQKQRVVVEKVNIAKKAMRPTQARVPRVQAALAREQAHQRAGQESPRLQEVRQGY